MISEIRELSGAKLEVVAGGMECQSALALAKVYATIGMLAGSMGRPETGLYFTGLASGVTQGSCPYHD